MTWITERCGRARMVRRSTGRGISAEVAAQRLFPVAAVETAHAAVVGNSTIGNRVLRGGIGAFDGAGRTVTAAGPVGSLETAGTPFTPHQLSKNSGFPAGIVDGRSWIAHVDRAAAPAGSNYGAPLRCFRGRSLWSLLGFCIAVDLEPTETLEGDCQKWWSTASKRPRGGSAICEGWVFWRDQLARPGTELLPIVLVVTGILSIAFFVWYVISVIALAPELLAEVFLDGVLSAALYRRLRRIEGGHWIKTVFARTRAPFLWALLFFAFVGVLLQHYAPEAASIGGVIAHIARGG